MLIDNIKKSEGFVDHVYKDSLGKDTIGYGTLMPLTEAECELLLAHRLDKMKLELADKEPGMQLLNKVRQDVLYEMAYQMGVNGVTKFHNMWKAIRAGDYAEAAVQMLDSRWAKQTASRANRLANIMEHGEV